MKVRITKAQAIEAIRTEPLLAAGHWIRRNDDEGESPNALVLGDEKFCQVCAVGAVLRDVLAPDQPLMRLLSVAERATWLGISKTLPVNQVDLELRTRETLDKGQVWNALSILFEGHVTLLRNSGAAKVNDYGNLLPQYMEQVRAVVCQFVDQYFPEDWTVDVLDNMVLAHVKEVTP